MLDHDLHHSKPTRPPLRWIRLALAGLLAVGLGASQGGASQTGHPRRPILTKSGERAALVAAAAAALESQLTETPGGPTDQSKVPHYFGPFPNWANSPLTLPDVVVEILGDGDGAQATASVGADGALTGIYVQRPGRGYSGATVTIGGAGSGAAAEAEIQTSAIVSSIEVLTSGYSYSEPVAVLSGGTPTVAATAIAYGGVDWVAVSNGGSGYTMPTVDFDLPDDPDGVPATAHAEFDANGEITAIVVDQPGSGYQVAPNVIVRDGTIYDPILNGGAGATAYTTLAVQSVVVDSFGEGYLSQPTVTISDLSGIGAGASANAVTDVGAITAIRLTQAGEGYVATGGIEKFRDPLPGFCTPPACPASGKFIPVAVAQSRSYNGIVADEYAIGLVQYEATFSSSLPPTLLRGYVQLETPANAAISQHIPLFNKMADGSTQPIPGYFGVTPPQYLGPLIQATRGKPVRIVFRNLLPTGSGGDLFVPADSSMMGSGMGPMEMGPPEDLGSVMDEARNPMCSASPKPVECFRDDRAVLHLHGGITPWISDGTPHQWITPANENTPWPEGVSVRNVPDMNVCTATDDGCQTYYYTNQQSARMLWYHDHSWGITRLNVFVGEAGAYVITDSTEAALLQSGTIPGAADTLALVFQDKTFVPDVTQLSQQDPTWDYDRWGDYGDLWQHHVYMPAQNPGDPSGMSAMGRWMYGPWFWPPASDTMYGPIANPYFNMDPATNFTQPLAVACNLDDPTTWQYATDPFCEPETIPGTPNISVGMEQFNDTPIVNGVAYPTVTLAPKSYRMRLLNAANDRFFNLQWYVADPTTESTRLNAAGEVIGGTEVALKAAELAAAQLDPNVFPTPDTQISEAGPDWIQIGTEGGFLPGPVVVDGQQVTTWITDPSRFDVGNVDKHSMVMGPAERADVIVDFSRFAGKTLILYNDAPAAYPARIPAYDYYTGAPDLSPAGAPTILPGYGPNTRTVMQVKIASAAPAPAFNLTRLRAAFRHNANLTGVFEKGQHPIIVGQAAYNTAYGTSFAGSSNCNSPGSTQTRCDGFVRVSDTELFGFNTLRAPTAKMTMHLEPKAIHDEMNSTTFDEYGRMQATMGVEAQPPTPGGQNVTLYPYVNPPTELIDASGLPVGDLNVTPISTAADGTQIWRITHNGVDTHPVHFHLFDVQLVNRVTWDNIILPPEATEIGWKDTVRTSPLEDTIVALRPILPSLPWEIPNSIRTMSPMMPIGSTAMFNNIDPQGNPTNPIVNDLVNFGWEYVYHCHILSHEEMDMMRPVSVAVPPLRPDGLVAAATGSGTSRHIQLTWNDNSITETAFVVQRTENGIDWIDIATTPSPLALPNLHGVRTFVDLTASATTPYQYRVAALNMVGYGAEFPSITARSVSVVVGVNKPAAPTGLTATFSVGAPLGIDASRVSGIQIALAWRDNANNEASYLIERGIKLPASGGVSWGPLATVPAQAGSGGNMAFVDSAIVGGNTYTYRVAATNAGGTSTYVTSTPVVVPTVPNAPTGLQAVTGANSGNLRSIVLTWQDRSNNETGFTLQRANNSGFTGALNTVTIAANSTTATQTGLPRNSTYYYRIRAINGAVAASAWVNATPFPITTNP